MGSQLNNLLNFQLFSESLLEKDSPKIKDEMFSAYHGRYTFDVTRAHELIRDRQIKYKIKDYSIEHLKLLQKSFLTLTQRAKVNSLEIDYERPLAIVVCAYDPILKEREWFMIDGNHRISKASKDRAKTCKVWEISDPEQTNMFFKLDPSKKKSLFIEED